MQKETRESKMPSKGKQGSLKCHVKAKTRQSKMPGKGKLDSLKCHAKANKTV